MITYERTVDYERIGELEGYGLVLAHIRDELESGALVDDSPKEFQEKLAHAVDSIQIAVEDLNAAQIGFRKILIGAP